MNTGVGLLAVTGLTADGIDWNAPRGGNSVLVEDFLANGLNGLVDAVFLVELVNGTKAGDFLSCGSLVAAAL